MLNFIQTIWQQDDKLHELARVPGCRVIISASYLPGHIRAIMIYGGNIIFTRKYESELRALAAAEKHMLEHVRMTLAA